MGFDLNNEEDLTRPPNTLQPLPTHSTDLHRLSE